jgi:hypothetical protein
MTIDQVNQAAEIVEIDGSIKKFDNPVCGLLYWGMRRQQDEDYRYYNFYLADYGSDALIKAADAIIVHGDMTTAMGHGLLAFSERNAALSMAGEFNGELLTFNDMRVQFGTPDVTWRATVGHGGIEPTEFTARKGSLVEFHIVAEASGIGLAFQGYNLKSELLSEGEKQTIRFIAHMPGDDFGLQLLPDGDLVGKFVISGKHFEKETL